jgi:hypothetical protein
MRRLIGLKEPVGSWPANLTGVSVVIYSPELRGTSVPGFQRRTYRGMVVLEPEQGG